MCDLADPSERAALFKWATRNFSRCPCTGQQRGNPATHNPGIAGVCRSPRPHDRRRRIGGSRFVVVGCCRGPGGDEQPSRCRRDDVVDPVCCDALMSQCGARPEAIALRLAPQSTRPATGDVRRDRTIKGYLWHRVNADQPVTVEHQNKADSAIAEGAPASLLGVQIPKPKPIPR
jgi:hypothetical protein